VTVIAAIGCPSAPAAKALTATIPIVFIIGFDPVEVGLVTSLSRPDSSPAWAILTNTLAPKQLELLHELVPTATLVAFLVNPRNPIAESDTRDLRSAASATRQQILVLKWETVSGQFGGYLNPRHPLTLDEALRQTVIRGVRMTDARQRSRRQ
jgi:putative ABC transport system substrate-binding protein